MGAFSDFHAVWVESRRWRLVAPMTWRNITVPAGFETDLASIPRIARVFFSTDGPFLPAAIVHDWLYVAREVNGHPIDRAFADYQFLEGMRDLGVSRFARTVVYRAVRLGGGAIWARRNAKTD